MLKLEKRNHLLAAELCFEEQVRAHLILEENYPAAKLGIIRSQKFRNFLPLNIQTKNSALGRG